MARALCNASLAAALSDGIALFIRRRGYSGAAIATSANKVTTVEEKVKRVNDKAVAAWVPDPKTGYYKPEDRMHEIDPAELRKKLLSPKSN